MESTAPVICAACGAAVGASDNFCEGCGRETAGTALGASQFAACRECRSPRISADGYCEECGRKAPSAGDHIEADLGVLAGVTDCGLHHHRNEDAMALAVVETPAGPAAVAVVCDGVSTSERPDQASRVAADTAVDVLAKALRDGIAHKEALTTAAAAASTAVRQLAGKSENAPAATYISAVVSAKGVTVCWVGDSRAYWLPADSIPSARLLTRDDSLAEELIATGMAEVDVIASQHGHIVTRWLGADADTLAPHTATFEPPTPGILLLCSDGLWNYQPAAGDLNRLAMPRALTDLPGAAADLLTFALEAGGRDNITVVLIAFPPRPPDPATNHRSTAE